MMKNKKTISMLLGMIFAIGLLYLILRKVNPATLLQHIKTLNILWVFLGIILFTIGMLIRAYKWKEMLKDNGILISTKESFLAYNLGNTLNIIVPAKIGDIARSYYLKKLYGHGYSQTLPSIFLDRIFDVVGVYICLLISSIYVLSRVNMPGWFYNLILAGFVCLVAVFFVMQYIIKNKNKINSIKNKSISTLLSSLIDVSLGSVINKIKFLKLSVYSAIAWMCDGLLVFVVFKAMSQEVNPLTAVFCTMAATLTKVFPVTPGGIGVFEGTMVIILSLFGLDSGITGIGSTLSHFVMNVYTLCVGIYVLFISGIKISEIMREKVKDK